MQKKFFVFLSLTLVAVVPFLFKNKAFSAPEIIEPKGSCCVFIVNLTHLNRDYNECFGKEKNYTCTDVDVKKYLKDKKGLDESAYVLQAPKSFNNKSCYRDETIPGDDKYYCSDDGKLIFPTSTASSTKSIKDTRVKSNLSQKGLVPQETGYLMDNCIKDGNCSICAVLATFAYAINWLFKFGVLGAFLMVTRYGLMLLTSAGNETKVKDGKNGIKGTIIGIIILFSGWTIVDTVLVSFMGGSNSSGVSVQESWNRSIFNDGTKWYQFCNVNMKK